jgi:flagellum-specific peptidoglycan hydrolase FlgJ
MFLKYYEPAESFNDHACFLTGRSRYASLNLSKEDYKGWANGLRRAGYATDPKYPEKLISYIERYDLGRYDAIVMGKDYTPFEKQEDKNRCF